MYPHHQELGLGPVNILKKKGGSPLPLPGPLSCYTHHRAGPPLCQPVRWWTDRPEGSYDCHFVLSLFVKEILDDLVEHFSLQLNYQMSLNHFALHIHRLFFRNHSSLYFQNDFHNNLKNTHPFIYELAVYFAY